MGRDDARAVGNLQGGTAPAQAWAAFMRTAVAKRPVEEFDTDVTFPERLDEEEALIGEEGQEILLDENGNPIEGPPTGDAGSVPEEAIEPESVDEQWVDQALGRSGERGDASDGEQPERNNGPKTVDMPR
jgi:penicillin-binding protein 1A